MFVFIILFILLTVSLLAVMDLQVTVWEQQDEIRKIKRRHRRDLKDVYKEGYVAGLSTQFIKADEQ